MIEWLQTYAGFKNVSQMNQERQELINLKKEIKKYEKKYQNIDNEMHCDSHSEQSEDEDQDKVDELITINAQRNQNRARSSVSAEVYGDYHKKGDFKPKVIPKKQEQKERLQKVVAKSFIFNNLDEKDLNTVLDAIEEARFNAGEKVIVEGDKGDVLYVVESGELSCTKVLKQGDGPKFLKNYVEGESFGELALLYNAPRAATITANNDCILWALDRETFNHIVKDAAIKKREQYEAFLKSMEILKDINSYELTQICDALKTKYVEAGTVVIKENEDGDDFYIIAEGEAYAEKIPGYGKAAIKVKDYKTGDYFGELALLKNEPRAASVIAQVN
jgi:cAMP-dependent protein kinase regulator